MSLITRSCLAVALLSALWSPRFASAEEDMRAKIEAVRQRLEEERALPEEERWELDESRVTELEQRAADGDGQAAQFLELARVRMAKLRRERYIQKWGRALNDPDVDAELRGHARRMAQLRRVRWLAVQKAYPVLVQRADVLMRAERARHAEHVAAIVRELRSGAEDHPDGGITEEP